MLELTDLRPEILGGRSGVLFMLFSADGGGGGGSLGRDTFDGKISWNIFRESVLIGLDLKAVVSLNITFTVAASVVSERRLSLKERRRIDLRLVGRLLSEKVKIQNIIVNHRLECVTVF